MELRACRRGISGAGLGVPTASLVTNTMDLRVKLLASGRFITLVPTSALRHGGEGHGLKKLSVDMPSRPCPVTIFTLKNRTLSPVVERFIECAREVAKAMAGSRVAAPRSGEKPNVS